MKNFTISFLFMIGIGLEALGQILNPVAVTGYNHDVVAEGTETSSLATTTLEMDAVSISNYVMCTKEFADANGFTPANIYGLPNDGLFNSTTRNYQMAPFEVNNVLYLFSADSGNLVLTQPTRFTDFSIMALATEGAAQVKITFHFTDGSSSTETRTIADWFAPSVGPLFSGYGRVKRKDGPMQAGVDYEAAPNGFPRFSTLDFSLPCTKTLKSIGFLNVSGSAGGSFRAFIMAVSGFEKKIIPQITISSPVTQVCSGVPVQFTSTVTAGGTLPALEWRVNGTVAGTGSTFSATNLTDSSKITCTLTSNADCAFPLKDTSNQITIKVIPRKVPQLRISGADSTVCQGKPIRFLADTFQSGKNRIQWFKNFLPVGTDSVLYTLNQGIAGDRIYAVLYSQEICRTRDSVVSNLKTAKVTPVYNLVVQAPDTVYLDETPVILSGQPSFGKFTGTAIEDTLFYPEIAGVGAHLFQFEIPGNSCTEPILRTIVVRKRIIEPLPCAIEPATLLTPNGDGANENWVVGIFNQECILSANVEIFNRWGKSVYSKDQYQNDWIPGKDLSEGVYYFTISYNTPDKTIRKTGTLWLANR